MSQQGIYDFLQSLNVCKICILRYLNGRCTEYLDVNKSLHEVVCSIACHLTSFFVVEINTNVVSI